MMLDLSVMGGLMHLGLSGAVTIHVLLRKRDVRSATAWIGVAWLSPGFGALLYYVFGINRVMRRTSRMTRGITPRKSMVMELTVPPVIASHNGVAVAST